MIWKILLTVWLIVFFVEQLATDAGRLDRTIYPEIFYTCRFTMIFYLLYMGGFYE